MREITYRQALNEALAEELERDPNVFLMGEEVAEYKGAYKVSQGLLERFGRQVNVTPKLGEVLGVLFATCLVGVARNDGAALSLFDVVVKVFDKRVRVLLILKPSFERRVEHLAHRAEIFANLVDLLNNFPYKLQVRVIFAREMKDCDVAGLSVPVQTTVALF